MHRAITLLFVGLLLATSSTIPAAAQSTGEDATINSVAYTGSDGTTLSGVEVALWQSGTHQFTVNASSTAGAEGDICLVTSPAGSDTERQIACEPISIQADGATRVMIPVSEWPADLTGQQEAKVLIRSANGSTILDTHTFSLAAITRDGDLDGDGLSNEREASLGTNLQAADTDGDGLSDKMEVGTYGSDPKAVDTDGDGIDDATEVNQYKTDPTMPDTDDDGLADGAELEHQTDPIKADSDGDGVADGPEVNVHETDPLQADTDQDGLGDGVEINDLETNPRKADTDGDGLSDNLEINTYQTDPTAIDTDGDGLQDGAEVNEYGTDPSLADSDEDGLTDGEEIHTYETGPTNPDSDGDGLQDGAEVNEYGTNPNKVDTDGDGQSDFAAVRGQGLGPLGPIAAGIAALILITLFLYRSGTLPDGIGQSVTGRVRGLTDRVRSAGESATEGAQSQSEKNVPEDLHLEALSKEERILRLLDEHDGRMRQADIVKETEWSKSTVSRVLADMESAEQVVKIDVGRGNIVTRPEDSPEGAASPFET